MNIAKNRRNAVGSTLRSVRERSELRSLVQSRSVRMLLAAVATVQGTTIAVKLEQAHGRTSVVAVAPITAPRLATVEVAALRLEAPAKAAAPAAPASEVLAARYRTKGYAVPKTLAEQIHAAAVDAGLDPKVAFGLVRAESSFRNSATSHVGAVGLTQLMPATARWLEPGTTRGDLRNPNTNLRIGFRYLNKLIRKYDGDTELALTAYNRGPGTVDRVLRRGGNPDNGYADMVLRK